MSGPHAGQPVLASGAALEDAKAAMLMVHGRGDSAQGFIPVSVRFAHPDVAYIAPQAAGHTWYPYGFMEPIERNQPGLDSGLAVLGKLVETITQAGIPREKIILLGFSQGACLTLEFAARNAGRFGGVVGLSGGLVGPDGTPRDYPGGFEGTPVFLGCSDVDFHIPKERVWHTAEVLQHMGAEVETRLYPGEGHHIIPDETDTVRDMLARLMDDAQA